tara:strand:+ start:26805 stop:27140 length:336 start_codon:yes stop_codon:yes gene_type:complete
MDKEILVLGDIVCDITGKVQLIKALDKKTGELQFRGNGINIFRYLHKDGNAPRFLRFVGHTVIFGYKTKMYTLAENWSAELYDQYKMVAPDPHNDASINDYKANEIIPGIL